MIRLTPVGAGCPTDQEGIAPNGPGPTPALNGERRCGTRPTRSARGPGGPRDAVFGSVPAMRRRTAAIAGLFALGLVLGGCWDDKTDDYNAEVEDNFVRRCTEEGTGENAEDICQCAYDKFREEIPFERFAEFDEKLREDPDTTLPDDIVNRYTDCY